jgi:hypothetical protein
MHPLLDEVRRSTADIDDLRAALAAAYVAIEHAGSVGGVVSVSGSYWFGLAIDGEPE